MKLAGAGARVRQHQHDGDTAGRHGLHRTPDVIVNAFGFVQDKHQILAVLPLYALGASAVCVGSGAALGEMVGLVVQLRFAVQHTPRQVAPAPVGADLFPQQVIDLLPPRRKGVNDARRAGVKEVGEESGGGFGLSYSVACLNPDSVFNDLPRLPVAQLVRLFAPLLPVVPLVQLAQGQFVGF